MYNTYVSSVNAHNSVVMILQGQIKKVRSHGSSERFRRQLKMIAAVNVNNVNFLPFQSKNKTNAAKRLHWTI